MSIINVEYLKDSSHFNNGKIAKVFGDLSNLPAIYLLNAGVIVGQAPGKVLKYFMEDADWNENQEQGRRVLNTLTMLASLDVDDTIVRVKRNSKIVSYQVHDYMVPANLGLDIIVNSSDRIYMNAAAQRKNLVGFYRELTNIDFELISADENKYYTLAQAASLSEDELKYDRLYMENDDAWSNVMSPQELKTWFMSWENQHKVNWSWATVEKKEYLISHYGCFFSGEKDTFCLQADDAGQAKDILTTALGVSSKVDMSTCYAKMLSVDPEEVYNMFEEHSGSDNNSSSGDEDNNQN